MSGSAQILIGDCVEEMAKMPADSVDAIVTDPPYGIGFMGKAWDSPAIQALTEKEERNMLKRGGRPDGGKKGSIGSPAAAAGTYDQSLHGNRAFQEWTETWAREAFSVLKPGGHLLAFSGTRTAHRMVCAIEDAGFEIRDSLHWLYGSGFPKSLDVSKAIDKMAGAEQEVVGRYSRPDGSAPRDNTEAPKFSGRAYNNGKPGYDGNDGHLTAPATEAAQQWQGWGTALKPAHEPICVARKPLSEKNVAQNVLKHGTGAINVDGCRVHGGASNGGNTSGETALGQGSGWNQHNNRPTEIDRSMAQGRWPPNLLLSHHPDCKPTGEVRRVKGITGGTGNHNGSVYGKRTNQGQKVKDYADPDGTEPQEVWECVAGCPVREMDRQSGQLKSAGRRVAHAGLGFGMKAQPDVDTGFGDTGGASRFFPRFESELEAPFKYQAKASRAERNKGLEERFDLFEQRDGMPGQFAPTMNNGIGGKEHDPETATPKQNFHPTIKPIALMRWLVRLVCPPNGTVLDPFAGSGSTGCAAVLEGFNFIGIEQDPEYAEIARRRIACWSTPEYLRPIEYRKVEEVEEAPDPTDPTFTGRLF